MAFDLQSGYGLGAGADELQAQLKELFTRAIAKQQMAQNAQRIAIEQQRANTDESYRKMTADSMAEERNARIAAANEAGALKIAGTMKPGQDVSDTADTALTKGNLGDLVQRTGQTPTRNLSGVAETGTTAPRIVGKLASTQNAGLAPKKTYLGTPEQQKAAGDERDLQTLINDPSLPENVRNFLRIRSAVPGGAVPADLFKPAASETQPVMRVNPRTGKMEQIGEAPKGAHFVNEPAPPQTPLVMVQTVDENGNPVTRIVKKEEGGSYAKPANATTATRVASAETVNEVGNDLIRKLSDPKYAAVVGPAMGRAGTLRNFIGNPPPEFSELAGQIESYALANMGVHGMRSTQGAQQITKLLDQHHTPESLAATIRGLNDFSTRFVQNNKPKAGGSKPAGPPPNETPEQRLARLMSGG